MISNEESKKSKDRQYSKDNRCSSQMSELSLNVNNEEDDQHEHQSEKCDVIGGIELVGNDEGEDEWLKVEYFLIQGYEILFILIVIVIVVFICWLLVLVFTLFIFLLFFIRINTWFLFFLFLDVSCGSRLLVIQIVLFIELVDHVVWILGCLLLRYLVLIHGINLSLISFLLFLLSGVRYFLEFVVFNLF